MEAGLLRNKKVLVTGSNGFIGSHTVSRLVKYGCEVFAAVRDASDLWRLDEVKDSIRMIAIDIRDNEAVRLCMARIKPEYVFHMAAYGVDSRQKDYVAAAETNIMGTLNIVMAAGLAGCEKLLNTGTSMQYGNKKGAIKEEEYYSPTNIYGSTKGAATLIAHQAAAGYNLDIATIIPFGVFGEKEGSHKFFPHVILSALEDGEISLSPCEQYRDYCYIENIIDGFMMAAVNKEVRNEIFNIGSGSIFKLKHYVNLIMKRFETGKRVCYGAVEYRKNDLWSPQPDLTKIRTRLGWEPGVNLEEGIDRTVEWFRKNHDKYSVKGR